MGRRRLYSNGCLCALSEPVLIQRAYISALDMAVLTQLEHHAKQNRPNNQRPADHGPACRNFIDEQPNPNRPQSKFDMDKVSTQNIDITLRFASATHMQTPRFNASGLSDSGACLIDRLIAAHSSDVHSQHIPSKLCTLPTLPVCQPRTYWSLTGYCK